MSELSEKSLFDWLREIKNWEKLIFSLIIVALSTLTAFTYNNLSLPKDDARLEILEKYKEEDKAYKAKCETQKALMGADVERVKRDLTDIKLDMKDGFKALSDKMDENNRIVRIVKENTK